MLRYQLNPHFLFNALNSLRALVDEDEKNARQMVTELSEFLRYSLISKDLNNVPLKKEIEAIRNYLAIEKKRYEEKLEVVINIDPSTESCYLPSFLIHPVVGITSNNNNDNLDHFTRVRCYEAILHRYPQFTARLSLLNLGVRKAGPRETLLKAIVRKNHGCTHVMVGRDDSGAGTDSW